MPSEPMQRLDVLTGQWQVAMRNAWFLDPPDQDDAGSVTAEWIADAFVTWHWHSPDDEAANDMRFVFGRSDATDTHYALYHDERDVNRLFLMTFDGSSWTMLREDPDFRQRWTAQVGSDRITGRWEASEDSGRTWRTDYDLILTRVSTSSTNAG